MFGENAHGVKIDLTGIEDREYSYEIGVKWSADMKSAIKKDFGTSEWSDERKDVEFALHYELACELVISDLLFNLKWAKVAFKRLKDENKG